jgi:predicted nucleic acid-binding protein
VLAVVDPAVVAAGLLARRGPCTRMLLEFRAGAFDLVVSPKLLDELDALLRRPAISGYVTDEERAALDAVLSQEATLVDDPPPSETPVGSDPGDEYLLALARASGARALVSVDPHLAELAGRLPILTPSEFLLSVE